MNEQKLQITSDLSTVRGNFDLLSSKLTFSNPIEELEVALLEREEAITLLEEAITGFEDGLRIVQEEYKLIEGKLKQSSNYLNEIVSIFNIKNKQYLDLIDEYIESFLHLYKTAEDYSWEGNKFEAAIISNIYSELQKVKEDVKIPKEEVKKYLKESLLLKPKELIQT